MMMSNMGDFPVSSGGNYGQFNEMIRAKERELQQIQDLRNAQLETMIVERDKLLVESSKRYEQLKGDFEYNLSLIEARDNEIDRLEKILLQHEQDKQLFEQQIRSMSTRLEGLQLKEVERLQKMETDKQNNKKILDELRAVIESVQWNAEEDSKSKQFEIDKLKKELAILQRSKDDALDLQRKDLTNTFEQIIQQREDVYQKREEEINKQINFLDQRFEKLQNENLRLKEQNRELKVTNERLSEDVSQKDDKSRQVSYQLQEEIQKRLTIEDAMKRQINALQLDLQKLSDSKGKEKLELESQLEKVRHEVIREQEFRQVTEKRLEECHHTSISETAALQQEIQNLQKKITAIQHDLAQALAEKESLSNALGNKRMEIDSFVTRTAMMSEEQRNLSHQVEWLQNQIGSVETLLATCRKEKEEQGRQHEQYVTTLSNQFKEQIQDLQDRHTRAIEKLKLDSDAAIRQHQERQLQAEMKLANYQYEEELTKMHSKDHQAETSRLQNLVRQQEEDLKKLRNALEDKDKSLKDEKIEMEALKLRMKVQDQQLIDLQQELRTLRQQQSQFPGAFVTGKTSNGVMLASLGAKQQRTRNIHSSNNGDASLMDLSIDVPPSPMFSDDFNPGTLSIPASPFTPQLQNYFPGGAQQTLPTVAEQPDSLQSDRSYFGVAGSDDRNQSHVVAETKRLSQENERLKTIIKEMRQDIELLGKQPASSKNESSPRPSEAVKNEIDSSKVHQLQECLEQSKEEILRLRNERKKLMDTSNELRSQLSRVNKPSSQDPMEAMEEMREKNVGLISNWFEQEEESNPELYHDTDNNPQYSKARRENSAQSSSRNVWDDMPLSQQSRIPSMRAEENQKIRNVRNNNFIDSDASLSGIPMKDSDIEVRGESFNRRKIHDTGRKPDVVKVSLASSGSKYRQGLSSSGALPTSNSSRGTTSQAQALQRLKEVKQSKINTASSKASSSETEAIPPRKVVNYATLAKLESEQHDSSNS